MRRDVRFARSARALRHAFPDLVPDGCSKAHRTESPEELEAAPGRASIDARHGASSGAFVSATSASTFGHHRRVRPLLGNFEPTLVTPLELPGEKDDDL
ncbi:MAG: hypothetical protein IPN34_24320 [Planctomycetes bacterium]|nr:hypothetical protein [Planctomycetota bacterium]